MSKAKYMNGLINIEVHTAHMKIIKLNKYVFKLSQMKINCSSIIWINKYENKFNWKIAHT